MKKTKDQKCKQKKAEKVVRKKDLAERAAWNKERRRKEEEREKDMDYFRNSLFTPLNFPKGY